LRGHRTLPHTADVIVEAWGNDRAACLAEAVMGLVASFAEPNPSAERTRRPVRVEGGTDADVLVRLLDEVIFRTEVDGIVPAGVELVDEPGGVSGELEVVDVGAVEVIGSIPKGISRSGLAIGNDDGTWRCRILVDV
jgi:SHS2 domain-containing protein